MLFNKFTVLEERNIRRDLNEWEVKGLVFELMDTFITYSKRGNKVKTSLDVISESYVYRENCPTEKDFPLEFWNEDAGIFEASDIMLIDVPVNRNGKVVLENMMLYGMTLSIYGDVICAFRRKATDIDDCFSMGSDFEYFALER